jgi:hypothetical protein
VQSNKKMQAGMDRLTWCTAYMPYHHARRTTLKLHSCCVLECSACVAAGGLLQLGSVVLRTQARHGRLGRGRENSKARCCKVQKPVRVRALTSIINPAQQLQCLLKHCAAQQRLVDNGSQKRTTDG